MPIAPYSADRRKQGERRKLLDRRAGVDRRFGHERRKMSVGVPVERRGGDGVERRLLHDRRLTRRRLPMSRRQVPERRSRGQSPSIPPQT